MNSEAEAGLLREKSFSGSGQKGPLAVEHDGVEYPSPFPFPKPEARPLLASSFSFLVGLGAAEQLRSSISFNTKKEELQKLGG